MTLQTRIYAITLPLRLLARKQARISHANKIAAGKAKAAARRRAVSA